MNNETSKHLTLDTILDSNDERAKEGLELSYLPTKDEVKEIREAKRKLDDYHINPQKYLNLTTTQKGDLLEDFLEKIIKNTKIFKYIKNNLTSTNEIDNYIQLNKLGRLYKGTFYGSLIPEWFPDSFSFECKNYTTKITVTEINKFHSTLVVQKSKLGVLLGYHPLTGEQNRNSWSNGYGLISKIALIHNHKEEMPVIIYGKKESYNELDKMDYDILEWIIEQKNKLIGDVKGAFLTEKE